MLKDFLKDVEEKMGNVNYELDGNLDIFFLFCIILRVEKNSTLSPAVHVCKLAQRSASIHRNTNFMHSVI